MYGHGKVDDKAIENSVHPELLKVVSLFHCDVMQK